MPRACWGMVGLLIALPAGAQEGQDWVPTDEDMQKKALEAPPEEPPDGWTPKLKLGTNVSFSHNSNVVGNDDGSTVQVGVLLDGALEWRSGSHEWVSTLAIRHQQVKTPLIDRFLKSMDTAELKSIYLYHLPGLDWLGPFGRFRLQTELFPSELVRAETVDVVTVDSEVLRDDLPAQRSFELTGAFEPLLMRQTAGAFARPADGEAFTLLLKAGAGAQQVRTRGGFVVDDDDGTPAIELRPLEDSTEIGAEAELEAKGALDARLAWSLSGNALYPFVTSAETDLEGSPLNVEAEARLTAKLTSWSSLEYVFTAKRIPRVLEAWQIQNGLLFNLTLNVI